MEASRTFTLRIHRIDVAEPVAARAIGAVGALADLSIARIADAQILIGVALREALGGHEGAPLELSLTADLEKLTLLLGPLPHGDAARIAAWSPLTDGAGVVDTLASRWREETRDDDSVALAVEIW